MMKETFEEFEKKRGVKAPIVVIVVVVVMAVAVYLLVDLGGLVGQATVVVRLHDAETIDLSQVAENYLPSIPNVSMTISGVVTVNAFSVTNVTVELYNKDTDEWATVAEDQTVTDMITGSELIGNIPVGAYDKVSVYIGTMTVDVEWTDIRLTATVEGIAPGEQEYSVPSGSYSSTVSIDRKFIISFTPVTITEEGTIDVDIGPPFRLFISGSEIGMNLDFSTENLDASKMGASAFAS